MRGAALLAVVVFAAAGCGGSEEDFAALRTADLAAIPVPPRDLGDSARGLVVDAENSGYANNVQAAEDTLDPRDTSRDVGAAGRLGGYNLGYWDEDLSRLASRSGIIEVVTGVDLFRTARAARAFLDGEIRDYRRLRGKEIEEDVLLSSAEARRVDGLGDHGWLVRATADIAGVTVHGTFAAFARDRIVGTALVTRADSWDDAERAEDLARALLERVERAARGELDEKPVKLVDADETTALPDAARLARLVLAPTDIPGDARVIREGALAGGAFEREFDVQRVLLGKSRLLDLQVRAELHDSPAAAGARLGEARRRLRNAASAAEAFAQQAGVELEDARVRALPVGADAIGYRVEGRTNGGRYAAVIVTTRVDRALGTVFAAGLAGEVRASDVVALAERQTARMANALGVA